MRRRANNGESNGSPGIEATSSQTSAAERWSEMEKCIRENVAVEVRLFFFFCSDMLMHIRKTYIVSGLLDMEFLLSNNHSMFSFLFFFK